MSVIGRRVIEQPPATESLRSLRWQLRAATVRGRLDMHKPGRESVRGTIGRHFPHKDPAKIERRFLEYRRRALLLGDWIRQGTPHAERVVRIEGLEHLEQALLGGTGAILASAHFGHARLIKPVLSVHGWPSLLVGVLRASGNWPPIAAEDLPVSLNLRPHLAALRANRPLIILVDGGGARSLTQLPVLGVGVDLAPGAMRIARATGAPVLPTFVVDQGTLRDPLAIRLVIHPPLALQSTEDTTADTIENLSRFAAVYAQELERNPHNLSWRWVRPDSGDWRPLRIPAIGSRP